MCGYYSRAGTNRGAASIQINTVYMSFPLQPSVCTLYPPHYDAVTSFGLYKDLLFSSCGVTIKQWDIKERCLKHVMQIALKYFNSLICAQNANKDKDR